MGKSKEHGHNTSLQSEKNYNADKNKIKSRRKDDANHDTIFRNSKEQEHKTFL